MDAAALNPIVLCHCQRYFSALHAVVRDWRAPDPLPVGRVAEVLGNLLWARSDRVSGDDEQREAMALTGALAAALGGELGAALGGDERRRVARALVDAEEERVWAHYDAILAAVADSLADPPASPAALNRAVWALLFPALPHGGGLAALEDALRARIAAAVGDAPSGISRAS